MISWECYENKWFYMKYIGKMAETESPLSTCCISEQKTKYIDIYRIFANEYIKRINENKTLQKCTFLIKVKNYIVNAK